VRTEIEFGQVVFDFVPISFGLWWFASLPEKQRQCPDCGCRV